MSRLSRLCIFHRGISCLDEEADDVELLRKVLYFAPDADFRTKIQQVGVFEALIDFSRLFSQKTVHAVHLEERTMVFLEPEPEIYFVMVVAHWGASNAFQAIENPKTADEKPVSISEQSILSLLARFYQLFSFFHGPFLDPFQRGEEQLKTLFLAQRKLRKLRIKLREMEEGSIAHSEEEKTACETDLEKSASEIDALQDGSVIESCREKLTQFFQSLLPTVDFGSVNSFHGFDDVHFLPIDRRQFLSVQAIVQKILEEHAALRKIAVLFDGYVVWSSFSSHVLRHIYNFLRLRTVLAATSAAAPGVLPPAPCGVPRVTTKVSKGFLSDHFTFCLPMTLPSHVSLFCPTFHPCVGSGKCCESCRQERLVVLAAHRLLVVFSVDPSLIGEESTPPSTPTRHLLSMPPTESAEDATGMVFDVTNKVSPDTVLEPRGENPEETGGVWGDPVSLGLEHAVGEGGCSTHHRLQMRRYCNSLLQCVWVDAIAIDTMFCAYFESSAESFKKMPEGVKFISSNSLRGSIAMRGQWTSTGFAPPDSCFAICSGIASSVWLAFDEIHESIHGGGVTENMIRLPRGGGFVSGKRFEDREVIVFLEEGVGGISDAHANANAVFEWVIQKGM